MLFSLTLSKLGSLALVGPLLPVGVSYEGRVGDDGPQYTWRFLLRCGQSPLIPSFPPLYGGIDGHQSLQSRNVGELLHAPDY